MPLLRWLNAGFLILAACRVLVPGLCATQLAASDATEYRAAHACCSVRTTPQAEEPGLRAPQLERAPCGFCSLMQGMLDPLEHARVCPPAPMAQGVAIYPIWPHIASAASLHRGRAPPFSG